MESDSNFLADAPGEEELQLPPRSRLHCLAIIGAGTSEVECVTSYLARLASAHCVSTWQLLKCEIAPQLFGPGANLRNRLSELVAAMGSAFNGENDTSKKLISILSKLTGRNDLEQTTMGFCHGLVGPRFLVRVKQAWCSACLSEFKVNGWQVYYPLLWQVLGVKACDRHELPLKTECPGCHRSFHPLTAHTRPGYCPRCKNWLGAVTSKSPRFDHELAHEVQTAKVISCFLPDGAKCLGAASESAFPSNVETLLHSHFAGNVAALKRFLKVNRYSVLAWKGGTHHPTLLSLVDLSLRVNVPIADLLCRQLKADDFNLQADDGEQPSRRRFVSPPKTDLERMRQLLAEAAKGEMTPAPSLNQLAIQLKCNQTTLQRRFPELTEKIKARHQQYGAIRIEVRGNLYCSIVNSTVMSIHKAGVYPSQSRVRESLPKFVDMREPVAQAEWKRTLAKLNYTAA